VLSQPYHSFIYSMYPEQIPGGIDKLQDFTHFVPGFFFGVITTVFSGVLIAYILSVLGI
jgi:hypothetical protein